MGLVTDSAGTSFTNQGVNTGTTYYYKVRAYRQVGTKKIYSAFPDIVSGKPELGNTANLRVTATGAMSVTLGWDAVPGAKKYEIWRATADTSVFKLLTTTSSTSYQNTKLVTGQTYYYKVRAYRQVGSKKVMPKFSCAN